MCHLAISTAAKTWSSYFSENANDGKETEAAFNLSS